MNKRFLLNSLHRPSENKSSDSSNPSLFNVIKKNANALLLKDFQSHSKNSETNNVLRSVINSGKESLNPLTRLLYKNDKLELLRSFTGHFNEKFNCSEILGYVSQQNSIILLENIVYFKQALSSDLHIFKSDQVRFSTNVLIFKGTIEDKNYEFLLNKKRLRWFLRNCQISDDQSQPAKFTLSHPSQLSQKLVNLVNCKEPSSFVPEDVSFLLFDSMFLPKDIVISKAFMVIY